MSINDSFLGTQIGCKDTTFFETGKKNHTLIQISFLVISDWERGRGD